MRPNMTFLVMWCQCWHQMTLMASLIPPLHMLVQDDWTRYYMTFSVIWHCLQWHAHHLIPMALSITQLQSLGQDDFRCNITFLGMWWHWCWFWPHVILVALSHDANCVINGTIAFLSWRWLKLDETWFSGYVTWLAPESAPCYAKDIINVTTFVWLR